MSPRLRAAVALGLRIERLRAAWASAAVVLAVYVLTMARDLTFYDSGELALVARELGLGHPIGQPLHTWIGFVFAHLPGIDPLLGLTSLSALFGALAIVPAWALAERLAGERASSLVIAPVLVAAALHPLAWEPSTRIEVYSLAAFLALWAVARASEPRASSWPAGLALGLAASTNAVIAAAHAAAIAPALFGASRGGRVRAFALFALAGLAGLVPYVHVLLVSGDHARFVWGAPSTPGALAAYFSGADYAHNAGIDPAAFLAHLGALGTWSALEGTLPIAIVGLAVHLSRARATAGLSWSLSIAGALSIAFVARNVVFHPDVPDYRGYLLAPWLLCAAGVAALGALLVARGGRFRVYGWAVPLLPMAALFVSPLHLTGPRDTPSLARALAEGALGEAPRGAILLVEADHWVAPLLYAQEAEGLRSDVVILARGLASSSWYWEHLFARHPSLERFELQGPGGRDARMRRFFAENAERPVLAESWALAEVSGRPPCGVGWLLLTEGCEGTRSSEGTRRIEALGSLRAEALEVAGRVGLARGEALWRLGHGADAYSALLAGLELDLPGSQPGMNLPERAPPLRGPLPSWSRPAAIHDPARNLLVAALLLDALGRRAECLALLQRAASMGLPEAVTARTALAPASR